MKASINAMTLEEIHQSIWMHKKDLYLVAEDSYDETEFFVQIFNGGYDSWKIGGDLSDIKEYLIMNKFFPVCHFKDLDMESILVERGF